MCATCFIEFTDKYVNVIMVVHPYSDNIINALGLLNNLIKWKAHKNKWYN